MQDVSSSVRRWHKSHCALQLVLDWDILQVHNQTGSFYFARHKHKSQHDLPNADLRMQTSTIQQALRYASTSQHLICLNMSTDVSARLDTRSSDLKSIIWNRCNMQWKKYDAKFIVSDSFISQCDTLPPCKRLRLARGGRCRNPCATSLGPEKHLVARCTIAQQTQLTQWTGTGTQQVDAIDINWHELGQHFRFLRPLLT